jgi:hypothetical protein
MRLRDSKTLNFVHEKCKTGLNVPTFQGRMPPQVWGRSCHKNSCMHGARYKMEVAMPNLTKGVFDVNNQKPFPERLVAASSRDRDGGEGGKSLGYPLSCLGLTSLFHCMNTKSSRREMISKIQRETSSARSPCKCDESAEWWNWSGTQCLKQKQTV